MWWCPIFKRPHEEAELILCFFLAHAKRCKHFFLQFATEYTYRTSAYFGAVQHYIVSIGLNIAILADVIHPFNMLRLW